MYKNFCLVLIDLHSVVIYKFSFILKNHLTTHDNSFGKKKGTCIQFSLLIMILDLSKTSIFYTYTGL